MDIATLAVAKKNISHLFNPYKMATKNKYVAQLHAHSNASDGALTPTQLKDLYLGAGYHVLAITDHDMVTAQPVSTLLPIMGNELSQSSNHIGSLFNDYTRGAETDLQTMLWGCQQSGGLPILNHPNWGSPASWPIASIGNYHGQLGIEMFNAETEQDFHGKKGFAVDVWDYLLSNVSKFIWGIATDDYHTTANSRHHNVGRIIVFSPTLTIEGIKQAILNGCFVADVGITDVDLRPPQVGRDRIYLECPGATKIRFIGDNGVTLKDQTGEKASYFYALDTPSYVRCEVTGDYADNFASDSGNWIYPFGTWVISGGLLQNTVAEYLPYPVAKLTKPVYGDLEIYFEGRIDTQSGVGTEYIGIEFHAHRNLSATSGNHAIQSGYLFNFYTDGGATPQAKLWENNAGTFTALATQENLTINPATWYCFKVKREGNNIKVKWWTKGETEPDWIFNVDNGNHSHGWVSLISLGVTSSFDNFSIDGIKSYYQPIVLSN